MPVQFIDDNKKDNKHLITSVLSSLGLSENDKKIFTKYIQQLSATIDISDILLYFTGAYGKIDKKIILQEIKDNKIGYSSVIYSEQKQKEKNEIEKLNIQLDIQDCEEFPCPKCKGVKVLKCKAQLRGGDEPESILLYCQKKGCKHQWRRG